MKRMPYQSGLLNKTLVIGILILFVGMSVVSSTGNIVEDISSNTQVLDSVDNSEELKIRGKIAYAYIADPGSSGLPEGPCFFALDDPGNITLLKPTSSGNFLTGGTWTCDGRWLGCEYGSGCLWEIDRETGDMWSTGDGGTNCHGLSWDPIYNRLYATDGSNLIEYDPDTGEQEFIGSHCQTGKTMVGLAINLQGVCYAWDVLFSGVSTLFTVDLETGEATEVGDLGMPLVYGGDGHFDYDTDILYITSGNQLFKLDEEGCTLVGNFEGGVYITCLAIPYDTTPPVTIYSLDPPEPDGENGWYVDDITVTLNATDDISGVKEIRYDVNNGAEQVIPGSNGTFILSQDGDDIVVKYWAIDKAGNVESPNTIMPLIDMDQTQPEFTSEDFTYEIIGGNQWQGWVYLFTANSTDAMSGMNRVEFYVNDVLQETVNGSGPTYQWEFRYPTDIHIFIYATAFDNAGNSNTIDIEHCRYREISHNPPKIKQQPLTMLFSRLIDRFPLLEVIFLRAMNLLR